MNWQDCRWMTLIILALVAIGIWLQVPRSRNWPRWIGMTAVILGGIGQFFCLRIPESPLVDELLFWLFGGGALFFAILMVTGRKPVYSALWFAMATLSTCCLFLQQSAPFLAAATIIVYAGAIVVTFVFVIMLAQQAGATAYDQRARQPGLAVVAAFVLLGAILTVLNQSSSKLIAVNPPAKAETAADQTEAPAESETPAVEIANSLSHPRPGESLGTLHGTGRSLFGDYLYAVELAGTLLLIASVGAIVIAPRRGQGT
ncbi:NADH-quinone oxidoreductase subunit J family protein [Planctomicrobium sp. SH527]|uniref:NADH-quinone oxidoreductase subunit J family protein n=1 Tax=Planctomicrobium sp. SH527 TaxID=3448123 RepID=UPI003F5B1807